MVHNRAIVVPALCLLCFFAKLAMITYYPIHWIGYCYFASTNRNKPKPPDHRRAYSLCPVFNGFIGGDNDGLFTDTPMVTIYRNLFDSRCNTCRIRRCDLYYRFSL